MKPFTSDLEGRRETPDNYRRDWIERESIAERMVSRVGRLYRERNVLVHIYENSLVNLSSRQIMKAHRFARLIGANEISEYEVDSILDAIEEFELSDVAVDVGAIAQELLQSGDPIGNAVKVTRKSVEGFLRKSKPQPKSTDVVLFGFGRIGRLLLRRMVELSAQPEKSLQVRAVVLRSIKGVKDIAKRASLLRRDSVHGGFKGTIRVDADLPGLIVNGHPILLLEADDPGTIDFEAHGISDATLIDNTGVFSTEEGLSRHLESKGISRVLLTAAAKSPVPNIVYGINHRDYRDVEVAGAASCTTNAVVPILKILDDAYGVVHGHFETVHAYTNDQNLIDNYHKKARRGRGAPTNLVITTTGAAKAVSAVLPEFANKLTASAVRVPTPNVSLAILQLTLDTEVSREQVVELLRKASIHSEYSTLVDSKHSEDLVSSDLYGSRFASVCDLEAVIVSGNRVVVYVWYDNEAGYANQVVRLTQYMMGVELPTCPEPPKLVDVVANSQ